MNQLTNPDIGIRAAEHIRRAARNRDSSIISECNRLGCTRGNYDNWKRGRAPSSSWLEIMCLAGYDVVWILTGKGE